MTSESAHGTVEKCLGDDEAFHFAVECSLATDQPTHFNDEPNSEKEATAQVQQALIASVRQQGKNLMSLSKGKVSLRMMSSHVLMEKGPL